MNTVRKIATQHPIVANFWTRTALRIYWYWATDDRCTRNNDNPSLVS
ncbi:hypothetical protein [Chamaesiphon sp. OTE_75_metabat_556]|nr:hypothetical protein [Chamaesiphon sp. OTE_75_metabat_556]